MQLKPDQAERLGSWIFAADAEAATMIDAPKSDGAAGASPGRVAGYRILGTVGRGGMGEVYVAFDERLQRRVALKAIRADRRLQREARERFLREARILSSLEHPHICRINDYLESAEGDYLVLELIEGEHLGLARRRLGRPALLRIAAQIADVLAAAHASGVVHRDLKPENVMLTPSGAIKVLDFGLAQVHEDGGPTEAGDGTEPKPEPKPAPKPAPDSERIDPAAETATIAPHSVWLQRQGQAIAGTPLYMSPEQARGDTVGAASDMYSFGLLLQTLFTGDRPYDEGLTVEELLGRARAGQTRPVTGIDRDLATLVGRLKSIRPSERPTAAETAGRLRWIIDKPRRRVRRAAVAAALLVVALAGVKYTVDLSRERSQAIAARNDAEDLLTFMLGDLRGRLEPVGRLDVLDAVGDKALEYFSRLPEDDLGDDDLERRASALRLIGEVRLGEGDLPAAEEAFAESLGLATDVVARHPDHAEWLADLGASHFYIGNIRYMRGDLPGALEQFEVYGDIADRLVDLDPDKPEWRLEQAYACANRGAVFEAMGNLDAATREIEGAIAIKRRLAEADPRDPEWRRTLANSLSWLASVRMQAGEIDAAQETTAEELEIRQRLVETERDADDRFKLATAHAYAGELLDGRGRPDEALGHYRRMLRLAGDLVALDPANVTWKREQAVGHRLAAQAEQALGHREAARRELENGRTILAALVEQMPEQVDWRVQLAMLSRGAVAIAIEQERWDEAAAEARAAIDVLTPAAAGEQVSADVRLQLAFAYLELGRSLEALDRSAESRAAREAAVAAIGPLATETDMPDAQRTLALALLRLDRLDEAAPVVRRLEGTPAWTRGLAELAREKGLVGATDDDSDDD